MTKWHKKLRSITLNVVKAKHAQILLFGNQNRIKSKAKPLLLLLNVKRKMFVFVKKIIYASCSSFSGRLNIPFMAFAEASCAE